MTEPRDGKSADPTEVTSKANRADTHEYSPTPTTVKTFLRLRDDQNGCLRRVPASWETDPRALFGDNALLGDK